jgi:hypothetical protein
VVVEFCGTTTVVFAGAGGLLLLIHPESNSAGTRIITLANVFMSAPFKLKYRAASVRLSLDVGSGALQRRWQITAVGRRLRAPRPKSELLCNNRCLYI